MSLTYEVARVDVPNLLDMLTNGRIVPTGPTGGDAWTSQQQAEYFGSLERRWPTGQLLAWIPTGCRRDPWYLLDGHRRAATATALDTPADVGIVRDLSTDEPTYLPAADKTPDGDYLPVGAILSTMPFLAATRHLPPDVLRRAEDAAHPVMRTTFDVVTLLGGTPDEVATLCSRLVPGRVDPATLASIAEAAHGPAA